MNFSPASLELTETTEIISLARFFEQEKSGQGLSPPTADDIGPAIPLIDLKHSDLRRSPCKQFPREAGWQFELNCPLSNSAQELSASVHSVRDKKSP